MAHLIDKDALVAEIERFKENANKRGAIGKVSTIVLCNEILSFIDTLEVKEVDLEKELNDYGYHYDYVSLADRKELVNFAKHFFELGVNASNPLTWEDVKLIWTIGDDIPYYMPEEDFFKELLKRFKAQKGE